MTTQSSSPVSPRKVMNIGIALVLARMNFTWTNPWGLARNAPLKELQYTFSQEHWRLMWPVIKEHVGPWAWKKPGP